MRPHPVRIRQAKRRGENHSLTVFLRALDLCRVIRFWKGAIVKKLKKFQVKIISKKTIKKSSKMKKRRRMMLKFRNANLIKNKTWN